MRRIFIHGYRRLQVLSARDQCKVQNAEKRARKNVMTFNLMKNIWIWVLKTAGLSPAGYCLRVKANS